MLNIKFNFNNYTMFVQKVTAETADMRRPSSLADSTNLIMQCRAQINQAKSQITAEIERNGAKAWDTATSWMELSRPLARELRGHHGIPPDASNAFFKCIELFNLVGPFLRGCGPEIRMFDNASLPGDFIRAAQWWTSRGSPQTVDWRANSLVGGLDDRFGLLRDHPERWMIHPATFTTPDRTVTDYIQRGVTRNHIRQDGGEVTIVDRVITGESRAMTGDVTDTAVCDEMMRRLGDWRADIYTSDLGFAVASYFHEEEEHFQAHSAQCYLGMRMLRPGGVMIVKTFTMSTVRTAALVSHLVDMFAEFNIVKPATSKPDNSECYWVFLGYRGSDAHGTREIYFPSALVRAQQLLARRQAQKITQNVLAFRVRKRYNFSVEIKQWCARHIDVRSGGLEDEASASEPK